MEDTLDKFYSWYQQIYQLSAVEKEAKVQARLSKSFNINGMSLPFLIWLLSCSLLRV